MNTIFEHKYNRIKETWHGTMIYNTNDCFIGRSLDVYGEWARAELDLTEFYAQGIVLDIGANIGTHTLVYALHAKHVVAFEPTLLYYQYLVTNLTLNAIGNVTPMLAACSDYIGTIKVGEPIVDRINNLGAMQVGVGTHTVATTTVDSANLSPSLIKIDVEGHELRVLKGARETIMRCHPVLYIECDRQENQAELLTMLEALGYDKYVHRPWLFNPDNYYDCKENIFPDVYSINVLALPRKEK